MKQKADKLTVTTRRPGFTDVTDEVTRFVRRAGIPSGLLTVFIPHTSASLVIQENADPDVLRDLADAFDGFAPRHADYRHTTEGPDDMPAHIRSALTQVSLSIPVDAGALALGTWQAIYLFEHRDAPHQRTLMLHLIGE
ncbi:MAG TPA: secondary thiamine-phosphate synthase enzyme YjbQ [Micropepsaceae bacterium]|jgi:secondary thiamine-phosphate synthase enzyme|nr:secondary thiamine-phosphate synthase enzyme YjbQ [Micropepsaceae bacterium]